MKMKDWVQILVGACILGAISFLAVHTFGLRGDVARVETHTTLTAERLSRIAEALPDVRARVAWEEFNNAFEALMIMSEIDQSGDFSTQQVSIYRPAIEEAQIYTLRDSPERVELISRALVGAALENDQTALSLSQLTELAAEQGYILRLPEGIDLNRSLVLRSIDHGVMGSLLEIARPSSASVTKIPPHNRLVDLSTALEDAVLQDN